MKEWDGIRADQFKTYNFFKPSTFIQTLVLAGLIPFGFYQTVTATQVRISFKIRDRVCVLGFEDSLDLRFSFKEPGGIAALFTYITFAVPFLFCVVMQPWQDSKNNRTDQEYL